MENSSLLITCTISFVFVFVILVLMALVMRLILFLFPVRESIDSGTVAAITSAYQNKFPGAKVTKIQEEK